MQANINITLAQFRPIQYYIPRVGDFVIWHGWFTHYYGIINGHDSNKVKIIKAGLPILLFTMEEDEIDKNTITVSLNKIKKPKAGYAIHQSGIWYV